MYTSLMLNEYSGRTGVSLMPVTKDVKVLKRLVPKPRCPVTVGDMKATVRNEGFRNLKALDTNVIIRHLVQDEEYQSAIGTRFIETNCTTDQPCFIGHITLCELACVLESNYEQSRK